MDKNKLEILEKELKSAQWYVDEFLSLPRKAQELLVVPNLLNNIVTDTMGERIDSPIEQIFITAFNIYCFCMGLESRFLFSQQEIQIENKKYYADFLFEYDPYVNPYNTKRKLVIECDGHNFHHKTKEQVTRDNEREYDLKMAGYEILRFSGSQIYNNPFKCAKEAYDYIQKMIDEE